jgi:hypothetical protein
MKRILTLLVAMVFITTSLFARPVVPHKIGSGGPNGSYFGMTEDIMSADYCHEVVKAKGYENKGSGGSTVNVDGMTKKVYNIIWTQLDVLKFMAKSQGDKVNANSMRVIMGMHSEQIHILLPVGYQPPSAKKAWYDFGKDKKKPFDIRLLKKAKIGAWGGSITSAQAISFFFQLGADVVELKGDQKKDPGIPTVVVGGMPVKAVQDILDTGKYVLLPLDHAKIAAVAPFYDKAAVTYKIGGKMEAVNTISIRALMMGKKYRSKKRNADMEALATCIKEVLPDLADDPSTNSNWGSVYDLDEAGQMINWPYFDINSPKK